jgi:hypothetical protein
MHTRWAYTGPCEQPSMIYCASLSISTLQQAFSEWSVVSILNEHLGSHMASYSNGTGSETLCKLWSHSHIGCVLLIHLFLCTFCNWDYLSILFWRGILSGDSVLKAVLKPSANVRFEVFTAVTKKNGVFWDVTPCGSCKNRRFGASIIRVTRIGELRTTLTVTACLGSSYR